MGIAKMHEQHRRFDSPARKPRPSPWPVSASMKPLETVLSGAYHFLCERGLRAEAKAIVDEFWWDDRVYVLAQLRCLILTETVFPLEFVARFDR